MGKRDKGKKKKLSKAAIKRRKEQEAKVAAQKQVAAEQARAEAIARGEDPDEVQKKKEAKQAAKEAAANGEDFSLNQEEEDGPKEWTRDIQIHSFTLAPIDGGTPLIHKAELRIIHGNRYALIGKNGAGKSTLLFRLEKKDFLGFPSHLRVHLVEQEMEGTDATVIETVQAADTELTALLHEKKDISEKMERVDQIIKQERAEMKKEKLPPLLSEKAKLEKQLAGVQQPDEKATNNVDGEDDFVKINEIDVLQAKIDEIDGKIRELDTMELPPSAARTAATDEVDKIPAMRMAQIEERLHHMEADQAEMRASIVLKGLGFTDRMQNMKTVDLSGGWRMRVALACGLFIEPDILLLDEPTNHLDFPTVCWLADYLSAYNPDKIVIVVSHEREFMNEVCTEIIHLHRCKLRYYKGNYTQFQKTREENRRHQAVQYKKQQREIAHQQDFIRRFAANKKWSTQAQSRRKVLAKMKRVEAVYNEQNFAFRFPDAEKLRNDRVLDVEDMGFSYFGGQDQKKYLLRNVNCRIQMGKKIGIIGANGAGKSTLLKLIMKELKPLDGTCFVRNEVNMAYFAQHHLDMIDLDATPLQFLRSEFPSTSLQDCFARLGRFNITPTDARKKIHNLSGGEKSRLAFCILTWNAPHLVIMDEPTNHLDIQTQDALVGALKNYNGSLLVVSHDKHLLTNTCDEFWVIGNQTLTCFANFDKATRFCYKKCKPVDVLPREFSTVAVKGRKDIGKQAKASDPANILLGDSKKAKKDDADGGFIIDVERSLMRSIAKDLKPGKFLVHLRGWDPVDGKRGPITIMASDMMKKYLTDPTFADTDPFEFFETYLPLINRLMPPEHIQNQIHFLTNCQVSWSVARNDNFERPKEPDSLIEMFECFFQFGYVTDEGLVAWKTQGDDNSVGREEALQILEEGFFAGLDLPDPPSDTQEEEVNADEAVEETAI